jgi:superfamily II DNA or RNA helicase
VDTVAVTLTNRYAWLTGVSSDVYAELKDAWSYYKPGYRYAPSFKAWLANRVRLRMEGEDESLAKGWDGKIRYLKGRRLPAGLFRATRRDLEKDLSIRFKVSYDRPVIEPLKQGIAQATGKYDFQNVCVDTMLKAMRKGGGIVLSATATGKTKIFAQFASRLPYECLFVVDQLDLLYQSQKEISEWLGEPVGVVGDSEFQLQRVTVATVQTLSLHVKDAKFMRWYRRVRVMVIDELHEQMNRSNFKVLEAVDPLARYGLTATLQLKKKDVRTRVYAFAGPVIFELPVADAMERDVVAKGQVIQIRFEAVDGAARDYPTEYREQVAENEVKRHAVKELVRYLVDKGHYVIVLTERVAHLQLLSRAMRSIPHRVAYGAIDKTKRLQARQSMDAGDLHLVIANKVFRKGINVKRVDIMVDTAEFPSKDHALQKFGRGVRLHKDKSALLYIDVGTQDGRFAKAASSRARAFRAARIPVTKIDVTDSLDPLFRKIDKLCQTTPKPTPTQLPLPLG